MADSLINPQSFGINQSMFVPQNPKKQDGISDNVNTISALFNPSGTLDAKQNAQIAEITAGLTLDGLQGDLLNAGFRDWDTFKKNYKGKLTSNKGFNRLRLSPQQKIEVDTDMKRLTSGLTWGKKVQQNYIDVMKQARVDLEQNHISQEDLDAFDKAWQDEVKNNKGGLGDLPFPQLLYNKMVKPKPPVEKKDDVIKRLTAFTNFQNQTFDDLLVGEQGQPILNKDGLMRKVKALNPEIIQILGGEDNILQGATDRWDKQKASKPNWLQIQNSMGASEAKRPIEIESQPGVNRPAPGANLMPDGTNRWPISAFNIPYSGSAYVIDPNTGKPTKDRALVKNGTRSEVVQDFKTGNTYTVVTVVEKDPEDKQNVEKQYIVYNAKDTFGKLKNAKAVLRGLDEDFGKTPGTTPPKTAGATEREKPPFKPRK